MKSSITYKLATNITVAGNVATAGATAVKKSAAYFSGAKGEEKTLYSQSYYNGSVDKTTLYTYNATSGALETTATFGDTTKRATGVLPAEASLSKKLQVCVFTGAEGEELTRYAQDYTGAKGSETVKDTVIYTYNADDSMNSSVTYKLATGITVAGNVATAGATAVKSSAAYFTGAKGEEKSLYSQSYYNGSVDKTTVYTYTASGSLDTTATFSDTTERADGSLPAEVSLGQED